MAPMSDASSTTQRMAWSRRGSVQSEQGSCSVRLLHTEQRRTRATSASSAPARRRLCSGFCLSKWYVRRRAVLRPMPGSLDSSAARSSITDISERQLERQRQASGQTLHFFLGQLRCLLLRLRDSREHEVLEHLDVARVDDGRVDLHRTHLSLTVGGDGDHPAAARRADRLVLELLLELLETALHLLRLSQHVHEIGHVRKVRGVRVSAKGKRPSSSLYSISPKSRVSPAASSVGSFFLTLADRTRRTLSSVKRREPGASPEARLAMRTVSRVAPESMVPITANTSDAFAASGC